MKGFLAYLNLLHVVSGKVEVADLILAILMWFYERVRLSVFLVEKLLDGNFLIRKYFFGVCWIRETI